MNNQRKGAKKKASQKGGNSTKVLEKHSYIALESLGFNMYTKGVNFLKESIAKVAEEKCVPMPLQNTIYEALATKHNTTKECIARCTQNAITSAWKSRKHNDNNDENIYNISFKNYKLCPKVKELTYYIAHQICEYEEQKEEELEKTDN